MGREGRLGHVGRRRAWRVFVFFLFFFRKRLTVKQKIVIGTTLDIIRLIATFPACRIRSKAGGQGAFGRRSTKALLNLRQLAMQHAKGAARDVSEPACPPAANLRH